MHLFSVLQPHYKIILDNDHTVCLIKYTFCLYILAGPDYTATTVTLTFGSGTTAGTTQTVIVTIIDDDEVEEDEIINIRIFGLSVSTEHAVISATAGNGTITIINSDGKFDE